ncbi:hypothetical protein BX616_001015 [Lobosporangium transversale]|uniref:Uncharacterized protein n=1 Tax=Lobosporangium transversale TaxID=64571 RepID=A0A1Y2GZH0_9FUNG|nr:hypothetical protein BCR41DRAFT_411575 [Lobosporangium transversale]KAF9917432.1 hypothetical protein BX616_001015 [Lobosporangium transversale]ORZ27184.1 hypothetical protein BCR41DRAFT_411575 [Lobosporangium transversale]|eukprot:XP_021884911.1 hypothetical protein BCR41DRAFT_411575 [Lobosporangium transversale]
MHALNIPEILELIGWFLPLWGVNHHGDNVLLPHNMLPCLSVSRNFRQTLLPIFWYTFDETAMSRVPLYLIKKYTPFIRAVYNFGARKDYPLHDRIPLASLVLLSTTIKPIKGLSASVVQVIKSNPTLRSISWVHDFDQPRTSTKVNEDGGLDMDDSTIFANAHQLERLCLMNCHWDWYLLNIHRLRWLLQPITATLKCLTVKKAPPRNGISPLTEEGDGQIDEEKEDEEKEGDEKYSLFFPKLEEIHIPKIDLVDLRGIISPKGCPNLQILITGASWESLRLFLQEHQQCQLKQQQQRCKKLDPQGWPLEDSQPTVTANNYYQQIRSIGFAERQRVERSLQDIAEMLPDSHSLDIDLFKMMPYSTPRHFPVHTIRHLSLYQDSWNRTEHYILWDLLSSSSLRLMSLKIGYMQRFNLLTLLTSTVWANPDDLTSLTVNGARMCFKNILLDLPLQEYDKDGHNIAEILAARVHFGWKVQGGLMQQGLDIMMSVFKMANGGFRALRRIELNGNVYRKLNK